jgi:DNA-directed RNA polymerase subunit H
VSEMISQKEHIAQMDANHFVQINAERNERDVRGAAHIIVAQLSNGRSIETKSDKFTQFLEKFIQMRKKDGVLTNIIIITSLDISPNVRAIINRANEDKEKMVRVEQIGARYVKIVVPQHIMVPRHTIISREETERLCAELHIAKENLPSIITSGENPDAMAAIWLGMRSGMVVRIERCALTTGRTVEYRVGK